MTPFPFYDWEREQVFDGYDPVVDGFAYPTPPCCCTVNPAKPEQTVLCETCIERLLSES